ncbi:hypothetical protein MRX96_023925 [Rhipicephalus microplus]
MSLIESPHVHWQRVWQRPFPDSDATSPLPTLSFPLFSCVVVVATATSWDARFSRRRKECVLPRAAKCRRFPRDGTTKRAAALALMLTPSVARKARALSPPTIVFVLPRRRQLCDDDACSARRSSRRRLGQNFLQCAAIGTPLRPRRLWGSQRGFLRIGRDASALLYDLSATKAQRRRRRCGAW